MMRTLRIRAELLRPAVLNGPLHLDALLTARHPAMHGRTETLTRTGGSVRVAPLPLCVARAGAAWVWCASSWTPPAPAGRAAITKRRDGVDYRQTLRTVYPSVGPDRDRLKRFPTVMGTVEFLAAVPDCHAQKDVRHLLRRVRQIGHLRKAGYGVVGDWSIEQIDASPLLCLAGQGETRRALPAEMFEGVDRPTRLSAHPPYWQTTETTPGYEPGSKGALCSQIITISRA